LLRDIIKPAQNPGAFFSILQSLTNRQSMNALISFLIFIAARLAGLLTTPVKILAFVMSVFVMVGKG
jgi:hypothetical protein